MKDNTNYSILEKSLKLRGYIQNYSKKYKVIINKWQFIKFHIAKMATINM